MINEFSVKFHECVKITAFYHVDDRKVVKNGVSLPYVFHCMEVTKLLWCWGTINQDMAPAAMGHDLYENTIIQKERVHEEFGEKAESIISELTFDKNQCSKEEYLLSFENKSIEALLVKVADRICNVQDFFKEDKVYAKKYFHKADCIFEFLKNRKKEVEDKFGEEACQNVFDAVELTRLLLN